MTIREAIRVRCDLRASDSSTTREAISVRDAIYDCLMQVEQKLKQAMDGES